MRFSFLKDVAIADIAFEAYGKSFERLLENCAYALMDAMADTSKINAKTVKELPVEGADEEKLLYNFLEELVYIKDVDGLLFRKFSVKTRKQKNNKGIFMKAMCSGDTLDSIGRENLRNDVKAITMHMFKIIKTGKSWKATIVADI